MKKKERPYIRSIKKRYSIDTENREGQITKMRIIGVSKDDKVKQITLRSVAVDEEWAVDSFMKHLARN